MPISTQLTQLARNVGALTADTNAIFEALRAKGVNVPANAQLSDVADMIEEIEVPPSSVEIGGRSYPIVQIGNQLWLAENLDYKFSGINIGGGGAPSNPHAWYYSNDENTYGIDGTYKCGLLYNCYAVKYLNDNKATLLPDGWHAPSSTEWDTLIAEVGSASTASTKLKALDDSVISGFPSEWHGTNDYGFNVTPSGWYRNNGFRDLGSIARYWTATLYWNVDYYYRDFHSDSQVYSGNNNMTDAYSLRLVKDVT